MNDAVENVSTQASVGAKPLSSAKDAAEQRRFERLRASLGITYRVVAAEEEAALLAQKDYVEPHTVKAKTSEMHDFSRMADERTATSEDISLGGLKITAASLIPEGTRLWLQVSLPEVPIQVHALAEVRWRRPVGAMWSTGLKFFGISKPDLDKVDRYLTLQKRASIEGHA